MALLAALAASGAAGLIYQICWIRSASLVVGSTTQALGIVLATFFGGLALGSAVFGRVAVRTDRPIRIYGFLEAGIAILGLASTLTFGLADTILTGISRAGAGDTTVLLAEIAVLAVLLSPPAVLMGGTLPLFCRHYVTERDRIGSNVSFLYALNTIGAAAGCLLAGFYLIPAVGMRWSIAIAAALNIAAAAIAFIPVARTVTAREAKAHVGRAFTARQADRKGPPYVLVVVLFFLTGAVALANEVLWTRFAAVLTASTVTTYTITIALVLAGIAIGSLAVRRLAGAADASFWFGALQAALALWVIGVTHLPPPVWEALGNRFWMYALLFLPPSIVSGASFPLAVLLVTTDADDAAGHVGRLGAANMAGGILGALAAAFVLPAMGLEFGIRATTALSLLAAWVAWLSIDASVNWQRARIVLAVAAGIGWVLIARLAPTRIPDDFLTRNGVLIEVREGEHSNLAVSRTDGATLLTSDHWWQGQDEKSHQIMAAHVPMLFHPAPREVLVIGVGAGQTPARFTMYDIERLDAVDIDPVVFDVVRDHFESAWMDDPRVRLLADDGRTLIQRTADRYDVISIEVGQLLRPGVGAFYTREFYERVRARLNDEGIVSQFVPLSFLTPDEFRSVVRTFLSVFPQAMIWFNRTEPLLIGSVGPRLAIEPARLALLETPGPIRDDLQFNLWGAAPQNQPAVFLASFFAGARGLAGLSLGGTIYSDDRPVLDYRAGRVLTPDESEDPILAQLIANLEPITTIVAGPPMPELTSRANELRARHLEEMVAIANLRRRF
jgi:spermidine synthase